MQYSSESKTKAVAKAYHDVCESDWDNTMPDKVEGVITLGVMPYIIKEDDGHLVPHHLSSEKIEGRDAVEVSEKLGTYVHDIIDAVSSKSNCHVMRSWASHTEDGSVKIDGGSVTLSDIFSDCIVCELVGRDSERCYVAFGLNSTDSDVMPSILQSIIDGLSHGKNESTMASRIDEGDSTNLLQKSPRLRSLASLLEDHLSRMQMLVGNGLEKTSNSVEILDYMSFEGKTIHQLADAMVAEISKYR